MFRFLAETLTPTWIASSFPIIRYVLMFLIAVSAITLIVVTLMQENSAEGGANAITGVQESYYSQNKGQTKEGRLKKITIAMASIITISIILFFVTLLVYSGS